MIHLTVAMPMGIDSVFFSFLKRLAEQNGHPCLDPPAQQLDLPEVGQWVEGLKASAQHHIVIGFRYPPAYWEKLVEQASTVCLLADPDGVARQVEAMRLQSIEEGGDGDLESSLAGIRGALQSTVALLEWLQASSAPGCSLIPPAPMFQSHPKEAFRRLEDFYHRAGVDVQTSCYEQFSGEAVPYLMKVVPVQGESLMKIQRHLAIDQATPARIKAVSAFFLNEA